ncbi:MAG: cysteine-rich CWC family protein [Rhizobacter sp.]
MGAARGDTRSIEAGGAARCPLCGAANDCVMACGGDGSEPCWCSSVRVHPQSLAQVPPAHRGTTCLCRRCALAPPASPLA